MTKPGQDSSRNRLPVTPADWVHVNIIHPKDRPDVFLLTIGLFDMRVYPMTAKAAKLTTKTGIFRDLKAAIIEGEVLDKWLRIQLSKK